MVRISIFIAILFCHYCMGQTSLSKNNKTNAVNMNQSLQLTKNFERFDIERFNQINGNSSIKTEILADGSQLQMGAFSDKYTYVLTPKNSYFKIVKFYYPNMNIESKGICYVDEFPVGIWYSFDEDGKLLEEEDYDTPFTFTFEDILNYCQKNSIPVSLGYEGLQYGCKTTIQKELPEDTGKEGYYWIIEWFKNPTLREVIKFDGKTGKIISKKTHSFDTH